MAKYVKPVAREISDLTSALGTCTSGGTDGGCVYGHYAGGANGCNYGEFAASSGNNGCTYGTDVIPPTQPCVTGGSHT